MREYQLVRILERKNKKGEPYKLAIMVHNSENNCDLIQALITEEQSRKLLECIKDTNFDISKYIRIEYNSFAKQYQPRIAI